MLWAVLAGSSLEDRAPSGALGSQASLLPGQAQSQGLGELRNPSSGLCSLIAWPPNPHSLEGREGTAGVRGPRGPGQAHTGKPRARVVPP